MIISHHFEIGLEEYVRKGKENDFPILDNCPNCGCHAPGNIHKHGFYWRYAIQGDEASRLPIRRVRCLNCQLTVSFLPDFLLPYFQYTLPEILRNIKRLLEKKQAVEERRQLMNYHLKRFLNCINWIHSFFVDHGEVTEGNKNKQKEATKYVKRILDFGESPFLRKSWGHLSAHFMAYSLYHKPSVQ